MCITLALKFRENANQAALSEATAFVRDMIDDPQSTCNLHQLLKCFGFENPQQARYRKIIDGSTATAITAKSKQMTFMLQANALYFLSVMPAEVLLGEWNRLSVDTSLNKKIPEELLLALRFSPLLPRLQALSNHVRAPSTPRLTVSMLPLTPLTGSPANDGVSSSSSRAPPSPISPFPGAFGDSPPLSPSVEPMPALSDDDDETSLLGSPVLGEKLPAMAAVEGGPAVTAMVIDENAEDDPDSTAALWNACIKIMQRNQADVGFLKEAHRLLANTEWVKSSPTQAGLAPAIKIMSWNTLKLGIFGRDISYQGALLFDISICDIVCLQEIPKTSDTGKSRIHTLHEEINRLGSRKFRLLTSEPSGKGTGEREVHAILYHDAWELVKQTTMKGDGLQHFDYAPLIAQFRNRSYPGFEFFFTSVHFPPEGRARDRDTQLAKFGDAYSATIRSDFKFAITKKGAGDAGKKETPVHLIMGDFNTMPKISSDFFNVWGDNLSDSEVRTTAGGRSFDHFMLNNDTKNSFESTARVLHLDYGKEQLSDHSPIILTLTRQPKKSSKSHGDQ